MRIRARDYRTGEQIIVSTRNGLIDSIVPDAGVSVRVDHEAGWVAPALFDLQINGCSGVSFNAESLTVAMVRQVVDACRAHGIGEFCPTLITNSFEGLRHGFATLAAACQADSDLDHALPVFHLEGPYISAEDGPRGAHPRAHVRPPNWDEFCRWQEAAAGRIRLVTLAPEQQGGLRFIEQLTHTGVVVALGHTAATGACIRDAIRAGARLSTHLGNGSHAMLPRHENYIWEQLAADELWASIIGDGHHLPRAVVRCMVRVKTPARVILTCDASSLAGLAPGRYRAWDQDIDVLPSGKIVVADSGYLAGSWAFTDTCVGNVIEFAGVSLNEAIEMATVRPRTLLGLPPCELRVGAPAQLVLFNWVKGTALEVVTTIIDS